MRILVSFAGDPRDHHRHIAELGNLSYIYMDARVALQWRHNECDGVSNHHTHDCLLNRLFRCRSKKTSKLRVTGLCAENSQVTGEFPHKWQVMRQIFPFDDVIMGTWLNRHLIHQYQVTVPWVCMVSNNSTTKHTYILYTLCYLQTKH